MHYLQSVYSEPLLGLGRPAKTQADPQTPTPTETVTSKSLGSCALPWHPTLPKPGLWVSATIVSQAISTFLMRRT